MNEDTFNREVRKFLKQVGVTSQREIERAVRRAAEAGQLTGNEKLKATARVQIEGIGLDHLYVIAHAVEGLAPGTYHYRRDEGSLLPSTFRCP